MNVPEKLQKLLDDRELVQAHGDRIWSIERIREENRELRHRYGWPCEWLAFASDDPTTYFIDLRDERAPVYYVFNVGNWSEPDREGNDPEDFALRTLAEELADGDTNFDPRIAARVRAHKAEPLTSGPPPDMERLLASADARHVPDTAPRQIALFGLLALAIVCMAAGLLAIFGLLPGPRWLSAVYTISGFVALFSAPAISKSYYSDASDEER